MTEGLDERFLPNELKWGSALLGVAALAVGLLAIHPAKENPPDVTGCYSAPGGPDIMVDSRKLTVLQNPQLVRPYHLENHKGWAITVEPGFDWINGSSGNIQVKNGFARGEFLFVTNEPAPARTPLHFELSSTTLMQSITYVKSAISCHIVK